METPPVLTPNPQPKPSPVPALILGFVPAALALLLLAANLKSRDAVPWCWALAAVSVVCCFTSSILLFKRSTGAAIAGGIVFLLLNGFIAFLSGCVALLTNTNFH